MNPSPHDSSLEKIKPPELEDIRWHMDWVSSFGAVEEFFDKWVEGKSGMSGTYDQDVEPFYHGPPKMFELLSPLLQPESLMIDCACGTGLSGEPFIRAGHSLFGVDLAEKSVQPALQRGYQQIVTCNLAHDALPWKQKFDAMIVIGLLDEWLRSDLVLEKWLGSLKDSAAVGLTLNDEYGKVTEVTQILGRNNFQIEHVGLDLGWFNPGWPTENFHYITARRAAA